MVKNNYVTELCSTALYVYESCKLLISPSLMLKEIHALEFTRQVLGTPVPICILGGSSADHFTDLRRHLLQNLQSYRHTNGGIWI